MIFGIPVMQNILARTFGTTTASFVGFASICTRLVSVQILVKTVVGVKLCLARFGSGWPSADKVDNALSFVCQYKLKKLLLA